MCQIAYKMAPRARIGFGTADTGEVGFANVIRGLAGVNSSDFPNASTNGFKADTECDDVGYFDEPFFQDGIIGMGVADASANGTCYFSSAANDIGTNGYDSAVALCRQWHRPDRRGRQHRARGHEHQPGQRAGQPLRGWLPQLQPGPREVGRGADRERPFDDHDGHGPPVERAVRPDCAADRRDADLDAER